MHGSIFALHAYANNMIEYQPVEQSYHGLVQWCKFEIQLKYIKIESPVFYQGQGTEQIVCLGGHNNYNINFWLPELTISSDKSFSYGKVQFKKFCQSPTRNPEIAIIDFCLLVIAAFFCSTRTCKPNRFIHNILWREICMV